MDESKPQAAQRQAFVALVKSAMAKHAAKQPLTPKETKAWARWEAEEDERRGLRFLAAVPKKRYCEWAGRQTKVIHDQADSYGVPLRGATINVVEIVRWLHDFFARHKYDLPAIVHGERETGESPRDQLVREQVEVYRRRVILLEQKIAREQSQLIPRSEMHALLAQLAKILRSAGERLHKQFGEAAASIVDVALDDFLSFVAQLEPDAAAVPPAKNDSDAAA